MSAKRIITPKKRTVVRHFEKTAEVVCLKTGLTVDIQSAKSEPTFLDGEYLFGPVVIWSNGVYAKIAKCKCENCNCKGKK